MHTRAKLVKTAQKYLGYKESDGSHRKIIDKYNSHKPLPNGYRVKYNDSWCAAYVSVCAIVAKMTDIIPLECSCQRMIERAKKMGIWVEDDAYKAKKGDIILYHWGDSGKGDCKGAANHVGIIEKVNKDVFTVIEGNKNDSVSRRTIKVNGRYIRGFITPRFGDTPKKEPEAETKEILHTVLPTDTLSGLAKKYGTTVKAIAEKNNIKDVNLIIDGQVLKI